jgi:hypothetical protein
MVEYLPNMHKTLGLIPSNTHRCTHTQINLDQAYTTFNKIKHKSKCTTQSHKTFKRKERENLGDLGFGEEYLNITTNTQSAKEELAKFYFLKFRNFLCKRCH